MPPSLASSLKRLPGVSGWIRSPGWQRLRHRWTLLSARRHSYPFTEFARLPTQLRALAGPVLDFVGIPAGRPLRIVVIGCSNGAEPYSIASVLLRERPDVPFEILAFDLDTALLDAARAARYTREEATHHPALPAGFVESTFDFIAGDVIAGDVIAGDVIAGPGSDPTYVVKPAIREKVAFAQADALDPELVRKVGIADVVFAQNFLYHLGPRDSTLAFHNLAQCLAPRAALFLDGCDLALRHRWTRQRSLEPLDFEIEAIHAEALRERGVAIHTSTGAWSRSIAAAPIGSVGMERSSYMAAKRRCRPERGP